ncbi:MAG: TetR/AcrR family transcriptional regulator [Pseudodonghicola sp.]
MADPPPLPPRRRRARPRLTREEKARLTRDNLLAAGCRVVAAEGYAAASVSKIAETAGVAQGTFYNYFEDRQALFDRLLPYEGLRMRAAVEQEARQTPPGMQREFARFEAFLSYIAANEGFYRVPYEAEIFAPQAHRAHLDNIVQGYRRSFRRSMQQGRMCQLEDRQLDCLIYQILGMRAYAAMQIQSAEDPEERRAIRQAAVEMYRLLMCRGLVEPAG